MEKNGIEWAAGLFEGEGSISCYPIAYRINSIRTILSLTSTDKDVLQKFVEIVNCGEVKTQKKLENRKQLYYWNVQNFRDCAYVLGQLYSYLGKRRKEKADELLDACIPRYIYSDRWLGTGLHSLNEEDDNV